jgi:hypothetical protein
MTTYQATFRTSNGFAQYNLDAPTPEEALTQARAAFDANPVDLDWHAYDDDLILEEIEISGAEGNKLAVWQDGDLRLRLAAYDVLEALETLVERDRAEAAASGFTDDEMSWLEDARRAIAKAKEGAI